MKIHQLLDFDAIIPLTNEEHAFVKKHDNNVSLDELHDRETVIAQNLVRKGIYEVSKDSEHLIRKTHDKTK
jgi:hypothetical protein